jgi:hypothetical protein
MKFPLAVAFAATLAVWTGARAEEKIPLPVSAPPMQVLASIDGSGRLVLRMNLPEYRPRVQTVTEDGKERRVTSYDIAHREQTYHVDPKEVRVYDAWGKDIDVKALPGLLKRETLALYCYGEKLDPLSLRLVKDGTLIFLYTPKGPAAPGPDKDTGQPADTRVPGLADFLKKQGYVAVPLQRSDDRLRVRVTVRGKELSLALDTGAGHTYFDRYRVRHLGLEWNDDDCCELEGLEIGGLKSGPLRIDTFDLTGDNRVLRMMNQPQIDGLLGADVLRPFGAVIDHAGAVLYLHPQDSRK